MSNFLGIIVCENYFEEVKLVIKNENIDHVVISSFQSKCGGFKQGNTLMEAIKSCEAKCNKIIIIGGASCTNLSGLKQNKKYKVRTLEYCFQMLVNKDIIEHFIRKNSYIVSPYWLNHWESNIEIMGLNRDNAGTFFKDFSSNVMLLDTGICGDSVNKLKAFGEFVNLPCDYIPVGLSFILKFIENIVLEWKLETNSDEQLDMLAKSNVETANQAMVFELLSELTISMTEAEAIDSTINIFNLFYGPRYVEYNPVINDNPIEKYDKPYKLNEECIWDDTGDGFLLKISYEEELLGEIRVYEVAYPNRKDYYMNLAIMIGRVCGLAIANSRKYEKQKNIKELLKKEKEKVSYILNNIHECVLIVDSEYKIIFANATFGKLLEMNDIHNIIGKSIFSFIHPNYHENALKRFNKIMSDMSTLPLIEEELVKNGGDTIFVENYSGGFEWDRNLCVFCVLRDITERKRNEKLKGEFDTQHKLLNEAIEYDKLKTEFLANLSHELRTPLNVLISSLQLLSSIAAITNDSNKDEKIKMYYNIMKQNCFRLLRLVNNLIDITKIDAGFYKLNLKNENIVSIVENISLSVIEYARHKGIEITFDTDIEEKIIACDADKIERIILNILSNSIKFTPSGGEIFVTMKDNNEHISVSIKDTGCGIPQHMQKNIFDRFVQVDKSLSRNKEGSGIGLSLVKSLVELHGGAIWINSENKNGSEFIFEFPVNIIDNNEHAIQYNHVVEETHVHKINIEFSDIYD